MIGIIAEAQAEAKNRGSYFYLSWSIDREYSDEELDSAELFLVAFDFINKAGEELGTRYDELSACPLCGAGARQETELILDCGGLSSRKDFGRTIAFELLVSTRAKDVFDQNDVTGARYAPVVCARGPKVRGAAWRQLLMPDHGVRIVAPTVIANRPFQDPMDAAALRYRCELGHTLGLTLVSEAYVDRESWDGTDLVASDAYVGLRSGMIRHNREIFVSQKIRRLVAAAKIRGVRFEVAHLV
ncbi:MAG TPA: hypothetical protein VGN14_12850 [Candidatus Elarobacter sp.]